MSGKREEKKKRKKEKEERGEITPRSFVVLSYILASIYKEEIYE